MSHVTKPLEALKLVLYKLFSEEEVRTCSLKGINIGSGPACAGFDKQRLALLHCKYSFLLI